MCDPLLRAIAQNGSWLADVRVVDPKTGKESALYTGQCSRLLQSICFHANKDRVVYVGQHTFEEETGLNGQSIDTHIRKLKAANYLVPLGKKSYKGSMPINTYYVNLPFMEPLEELDLELLLATPVGDRLAMFSKEALNRPSVVPSSTPSLVRDKQEQELEIKKCKSNEEPEADFYYPHDDEPSIEDVEELIDRISGRFSDEGF
jgi:hypothetical protein